MLPHPKVILPALVVVIAIVVATIGPDFFDSSGSSGMSDEAVDIDGVAFPAEINDGSKQSLVGGGTRSKWGFKVYAVGIYGEPKLIKTLKKKYPGESVAGTKLSSDFSESKQQKTLVLRFRRGVASKDISEALGEALVDKLGEEKSTEFSKFVLDVVGEDRLEVGSEISISCKGLDKLKASLAGGNVDMMSMKGLCPAIFAVYLGSNPVSQQAKDGFEKGFADLVVS